MSKPIEFSEFYSLLKSIKDGNTERQKELDWMLAEYEHTKESNSALDELGQIFCHHGAMELFEYTGLEDIKVISNLKSSVWDYLLLRNGNSLSEYMEESMILHAKEHNLAKIIAGKWKTPLEDIEINMEDLARYVAEGIIDVVCK